MSSGKQGRRGSHPSTGSGTESWQLDPKSGVVLAKPVKGPPSSKRPNSPTVGPVLEHHPVVSPPPSGSEKSVTLHYR